MVTNQFGYITSGAFSPIYKTDVVYACLFTEHSGLSEFYAFSEERSIVFKKRCMIEVSV